MRATRAAAETAQTAISRVRERNAARGLQSKGSETYVPHARQMMILAAAVAATLIAWAFLVAQAISFGRTAKDGEGVAWVFLFLATLGATACMLVCLILGNKLRLLLKGEVPEVKASERTPGGRRAAR